MLGTLAIGNVVGVVLVDEAVLVTLDVPVDVMLALPLLDAVPDAEAEGEAVAEPRTKMSKQRPNKVSVKTYELNIRWLLSRFYSPLPLEAGALLLDAAGCVEDAALLFCADTTAAQRASSATARHRSVIVR